jgi:hypothetical protein
MDLGNALVIVQYGKGPAYIASTHAMEYEAVVAAQGKVVELTRKYAKGKKGARPTVTVWSKSLIQPAAQVNSNLK